MQNFVFALPTRIVFGSGAIDDVGREAASLGKHGLLVTGSAFAIRSGLVDRLRRRMEQHGVGTTLFDALPQNPTVEAIAHGGKISRDCGADFVIGLGGGSALDAAKAIALVSTTSDEIWDFTKHRVDKVPHAVQSALPIVQVPIIASTGSETNNTTVVFEEQSQMKAPISSDHLFARVAIVDPSLTFSVPSRYTAVGAINIVSQMMEGYLTSDAFAVTDRVTEGLLRVVMDNLSRALHHADDLDARSNLSWAATMASTAAMAGRGGSMPLRALAYPLTASYPIEHGSALSGLWTSYMRYALSNRLRLPLIGRFKRFALLGRQLFGVHETDDEVAAETTSYRFTHWLQSMNMATDLRSLDLRDEDITRLAQQAAIVSGDGKKLPSGLSISDLEHIYEGALRPL